jgi:hypothetical protein
VFVLMAKQLNKQKKIDHTSRALHTVKKLFAVCFCQRRTTKMVARTPGNSLCCAPGRAAHDKAPYFAVHLVRQHTAKLFFVFFKNNYFAVCLVRQHTQTSFSLF